MAGTVGTGFAILTRLGYLIFTVAENGCERWGKVAEAVHTKEEQKREVRKMFKSGGQAIYEEGKAEGIQNTLIRLGRKRFGHPNQEILSAIQAIVDLDRLESLTERILDVKSWQELFKEPLAS